MLVASCHFCSLHGTITEGVAVQQRLLHSVSLGPCQVTLKRSHHASSGTVAGTPTCHGVRFDLELELETLDHQQPSKLRRV
jgi:hypothetical protein